MITFGELTLGDNTVESENKTFGYIKLEDNVYLYVGEELSLSQRTVNGLSVVKDNKDLVELTLDNGFSIKCQKEVNCCNYFIEDKSVILTFNPEDIRVYVLKAFEV